MAKRKYGDREGCHRCGQDIEWYGRAHGWIDRGANRSCVPYKDNQGEIITPAKHLKHSPMKGL